MKQSRMVCLRPRVLQNLLLTENMTLKIADFGAARKLDASGSTSSMTVRI